MQQLLIFFFATRIVESQSPIYSAECQQAMAACEENTDCVHRLAVLQSTCVTNTCQPQCRNAVLNLYQNRLGRSLLRTDISCIPGRYELELCHLIPKKMPIYCNLAKLACEADLICSSRYGVFKSECETEAARGDCNLRCREHLNETMKTQQGAAFINCTCTDQDDKLCQHLKNVILKTCMMIPHTTTMIPAENDIILRDLTTTRSNTIINPNYDSDDGQVPTAQFILIILLCTLLLFQ